ncbi:hypothetical protein PISMIDRAFT_645831 [Pisolithus microcarpus 441]|uniref:DUF8040 domain-containing protein n=1 Tax=Pisolithus microcarpus 441 TaxID=765257 RepID=A0A0C9YHT5_9AGAM|nr:hypothetical protein PISMIDRAFT_645831 [Pisolithus microcarpus 441]
MGHCDSKFVTLEEQLSIFLYTCVTGLTSRHVAERFQHSNNTISHYFKKMLFLFSDQPFYSTHVWFLDNESVHPKI